VIVPPHKAAVCSPAGDSQRDNHIQVIDQFGRIAWQKKTGYWLAKLCRTGHATLQADFWQHTDAWATAVALNRLTG